MIEQKADPRRLLEYLLVNNTFVGFQMLDILPGEEIPAEKILRLVNPGRIYKNSLAPEDKFDYANLDPEYTEPLEEFPTVVRIKRLAEHWRGTELTYAAGALRARQIN